MHSLKKGHETIFFPILIVVPIMAFENGETSLSEYFEGLKSKKNRLFDCNSLLMMWRLCFPVFPSKRLETKRKETICATIHEYILH